MSKQDLNVIGAYLDGKQAEAITLMCETYTRRELEVLIYTLENLKSDALRAYNDQVLLEIAKRPL